MLGFWLVLEKKSNRDFQKQVFLVCFSKDTVFLFFFFEILTHYEKKWEMLFILYSNKM